MSETCATVYKSPVSKLLPFFERSRNRWKEKHHSLKAKCKKLSNQVRAVEKSRQLWKQLVQEEQQRIRELERELEELKRGAGGDGRCRSPASPGEATGTTRGAWVLLRGD